MALTQRKLSCPEESFPKSGNQPLLNVQMIQAICMHGVCVGGGGGGAGGGPGGSMFQVRTLNHCAIAGP